MSKVENVTVKGKKRTVHLEEQVSPNRWRARVYSRGFTVSGFFQENRLGVKRFEPIGINADLL